MATLTTKRIHNAMTATPYSPKGEFKTYFICDPVAMEVITEATKKGYIVRLSHSQAQWTDEGLEKARKELN